ncbi:MAG: cell division protein FtsA [Kiritimatiellae bacterium]|nr:cell division protein FtsA [Kiritimatiellia bacterium]
MNLSDPVAAVEIGTTRTVIAIAEPLGPGRLNIVAKGDIPSSGVRKSQITDIGKASVSVTSVLKYLEDHFSYSIGHAALAVSGPQIHTEQMVTQWPVDKTVTDNDLTEIYNRSCDTGLEDDRTLLDISELGYGLDGLDGIASPKGMSGRLLKLRTLVVHGSKARISDARTAATNAKLEISESYFAGRCAAEAVLTPEDKAAGTLVIDLGGGSTSFVAFAEGRMVDAGVIGVGGDHVTNDIKLAFSLSLSQAGAVKRSASAIFSPERTGRVEVPSSLMTGDKAAISMRALDTVVNARVGELFSIIREKLDADGILHRLSGGIILTGGGAQLTNITTLARNVFGGVVRIGTLVPGIEGLDKEPFPAQYATIAGALLLEQRNSGEQSLFDPITNLWKKFFKGQ